MGIGKADETADSVYNGAFEKKMPQWKEGSEFKSVLEGTISGSHIFTHHRTPIGNYGGVIE